MNTEYFFKPVYMAPESTNQVPEASISSFHPEYGPLDELVIENDLDDDDLDIIDGSEDTGFDIYSRQMAARQSQPTVPTTASDLVIEYNYDQSINSTCAFQQAQFTAGALTIQSTSRSEPPATAYPVQGTGVTLTESVPLAGTEELGEFYDTKNLSQVSTEELRARLSNPEMARDFDIFAAVSPIHQPKLVDHREPTPPRPASTPPPGALPTTPDTARLLRRQSELSSAVRSSTARLGAQSESLAMSESALRRISATLRCPPDQAESAVAGLAAQASAAAARITELETGMKQVLSRVDEERASAAASNNAITSQLQTVLARLDAQEKAVQTAQAGQAAAEATVQTLTAQAAAAGALAERAASEIEQLRSALARSEAERARLASLADDQRADIDTLVESLVSTKVDLDASLHHSELPCDRCEELEQGLARVARLLGLEVEGDVLQALSAVEMRAQEYVDTANEAASRTEVLARKLEEVETRQQHQRGSSLRVEELSAQPAAPAASEADLLAILKTLHSMADSSLADMPSTYGHEPLPSSPLRRSRVRSPIRAPMQRTTEFSAYGY